MAGQREEISLRVLKNISGVSAPFELLQNAAQRRFVFVESYIVKSLSCVAWLSRTFSTFLNHFSISQQICISYWNRKICHKATTICLFSIFLNPYVKQYTSSKRAELTKFFPTSWSAVFSQVWGRSILNFCVYKLVEAVRYVKFNWEFVIIGRGCLVLLKFKSSLCLRMLCFRSL